MAEEKQKIESIATKLELLNHLLHDSTEIKIAVEIAATKIDKRLVVLEELLTKTETLKKKSHVVSDHVFALATKDIRESPIIPRFFLLVSLVSLTMILVLNMILYKQRKNSKK